MWGVAGLVAGRARCRCCDPSSDLLRSAAASRLRRRGRPASTGASSSYSHRGRAFLATGGAPRVWRGGGVSRRIGAAHRRAGSRAPGEDAALSLSRMDAPTCRMRSSLITLHSYSSMSREQTSLAKEPQSHGQPKKRSSDAAWTGEVAALVHLTWAGATTSCCPRSRKAPERPSNLSPEKKAR